MKIPVLRSNTGIFLWKRINVMRYEIWRCVADFRGKQPAAGHRTTDFPFFETTLSYISYLIIHNSRKFSTLWKVE